MGDDTSDILGTHKVPSVRGSPSGRLSRLSFGVKAALIFAVVLALYVVGRRLWESFLVWREKSYKLSMRRRHGIPDNDHRPFNVAYAAAMRARQDRETAKRNAKLADVVPGQDQHNALPDQNLRQRIGGQRSMQTTWSNTTADGLPSGSNLPVDDVLGLSGNANASIRNYAMPTNSFDVTDRYNPNPAMQTADPAYEYNLPRAGPSRRFSRKNINISDEEGRKRAFDEDEFDELEHPKKSRVEGDELIDGDEDPEWEEYGQMPQRGSKRVLTDEDENEDALLSKRARDKRARKVSLEKTPLYQSDDMEIDGSEADDEVAELKSISRGKKRDRAAAGSTFGGDDEDSAHEAEAETEDDIKARRRRRKRRTVGKRKSDTGSSLRGKKRDRDVEEGDSDLESLDGELVKVPRKKRGKRLVPSSVQNEEERGSDLSMDESQSSSARGRGRRIGDEWESNGVMFKIGPNGQRLRQALIKKARQKFNMPIDSQHPDREANLEVCVETWLTEDEFKEMKAQHLLAWQDSPKASTEPESRPVEVKDLPSPPPAGKNLLWRSRSAAPSPLSQLPAQSTPPGTPPRQIDPYRQSVATNLGLRLNPFQQKEAFGKRVASGARVASVFSGHGTSLGPASLGLTDSTNGSPRNSYKTFSKWEKQDLEAKAMMKMREANMKKQAEKEEKEKEAREKAEKEKKEREAADAAAAAAAATKSVPTITITTPAEAKPAQTEAKPPTFSFAPPSTSSESTKDAAGKQTSFFGPPPGASASSFTLGNAPPLGSEDKPPAKPAATQPSTSGPTFFTNPSSGLPAKPTPPLFSSTSTDNKSQQSKPQSFSFPAPAKPANVPTAGNRSAFTLGPTSSQQPQTLGQKDGQATSGVVGGSLLSRVASSTQPAAQPQQSTSAFTYNKPVASEAQGSAPVPSNTTAPAPASAPVVTSTGATTKPKFDFGISNKPTSSVPAPSSSTSSLSGALGNNAGKPASTPLSFTFKTPAAPASGTSTPPTAPKFSFAAPSSGTPASGTNIFGGSTAPTPATVPQSAEAQTKAPAFSTTTSFTSASGAAPFEGNKDSAVTPTSTIPQFGVAQKTVSPFGGAINSSSTSLFGTASAAAGSQATEPQNKPSVFSMNPSSTSPFGSFGGDKAPQSNDTAVKSAFSGFGNGTQGVSPSPFGSNTGSGASSTMFGVSGTSGNSGAAEARSTTPFSTPVNTGEAPKSVFSFGSQTTTAPTSAAPTNGAPSPFSAFKFGDTSKTSTTTFPQAPQPAAGQSIFGGMTTGTTPSAFGFGAPTSTSNGGATGSSNPFGQQQQ